MERLSERLSPDVGLRCWLALGISWSRSEDETIVRSVSELAKIVRVEPASGSRGMRSCAQASSASQRRARGGRPEGDRLSLACMHAVHMLRAERNNIGLLEPRNAEGRCARTHPSAERRDADREVARRPWPAAAIREACTCGGNATRSAEPAGTACTGGAAHDATLGSDRAASLQAGGLKPRRHKRRKIGGAARRLPAASGSCRGRLRGDAGCRVRAAARAPPWRPARALRACSMPVHTGLRCCERSIPSG